MVSLDIYDIWVTPKWHDQVWSRDQEPKFKRYTQLKILILSFYMSIFGLYFLYKIEPKYIEQGI